MHNYNTFIKLQSRDLRLLQERYKLVVTCLAFSLMLNAVLLASWLWEVAQ